MEDWQPGDKAVCIHAAPMKIDGRIHVGAGLVEDKIYHVYDVRMSGIAKDTVMLLIEELKNETVSKHLREDPCGKGARAAIRFRKVRNDPLEGHKDDFVRLLNSHRSKQPARIKQKVPALPYYPPKDGDTI